MGKGVKFQRGSNMYNLRYASKYCFKMVRSVCVAQRQRFPKNGVKESVTFHSTLRSVPLHGRFRFIFSLSHHVTSCSPRPSPNRGCRLRQSSTAGLSYNRPRHDKFLIPSCFNFHDISPGLRPWRW